MPTLDYRSPIRTRRYSGWGIAAVYTSLGGAILALCTIPFLRGGPGVTDYRPIFVLIYLCCLILGFVFSAVGYFKDKRQQLFCFLAFLISLLQVVGLLALAIVGVLLSKK